MERKKKYGALIIKTSIKDVDSSKHREIDNMCNNTNVSTALIPSFKESLINDNVFDATKEITEFAIDSLLEDGVFKNMPIVNVVAGGYSIIHNIRDYNFLRQTAAFIMDLNNGKIDKQTLEEHVKKLNNPEQMNKELSKVMIFLDRNEDIKKSEILAKLYKAYIKGIIDWTKFCECVDIVNQTILQDLDFLIEINDNQDLIIEPNTNYRINRIKSLGLIIGKPYKKPGFYNLPEVLNKEIIEVSELGSLLCDIIAYQ